MTQPGKYNCAVIGCGRIASTMDDDPKRKNISTHAGAYAGNARTTMTCASDIDEKKLQAFGHKWGINKLYQSYEELFSTEKVDVVSICTHSDQHLNILKAAANSAVKGIICEKPVARTLKEAEEMIRVCEEKEIMFAVCHVRRFYNGVKKVKELIEAGAIGDIQSIVAVYCAGIANQALHVFDTLIYLLDLVPEFVSTILEKDGFQSGDRNLNGYFLSKGNVLCNVMTVARNYYTDEEIHLYGTQGKIILDHMSSHVKMYRAKQSDRFSNYYELFMEEATEMEEGKRMEALLDNFLNALEKKEKLLCSAVDGMKALSIVSGFIESFQKGKMINFQNLDKDSIILSS